MSASAFASSMSCSCLAVRAGAGGVLCCECISAVDFSSLFTTAAGVSSPSRFTSSDVSCESSGGVATARSVTGGELMALVIAQSKFCGLQRDTTTVTISPVKIAAMLPARVEYSCPVLAMVNSPKYCCAVTNQATTPATRPEIGPAIAPAFDCPVQQMENAIGKTAPPMMRPITKNSQPRSMPARFQMTAKTLMVRPKTQMPYLLTVIKRSGEAEGLK